MKRGGGFTLIELLITITIMVILMTVAVVNMLGSRVDARDEEREMDANTIARGLEVYYENGNPYTNTPPGYYPGAQDTIAAVGSTPPYTNFLEGVSSVAYTSPNAAATNGLRVDPNYATAPVGSNGDGSYGDSQAKTLLATIPYLYQPLTRSNAICASYSSCVKYNLYYLSERDDTVQKIRSKNQ